MKLVIESVNRTINSLGIVAEVMLGGIRVSRDSMIANEPRLGEQDAYDACLAVFGSFYPELHMSWANHDDTFLYLDVRAKTHGSN